MKKVKRRDGNGQHPQMQGNNTNRATCNCGPKLVIEIDATRSILSHIYLGHRIDIKSYIMNQFKIEFYVYIDFFIIINLFFI